MRHRRLVESAKQKNKARSPEYDMISYQNSVRVREYCLQPPGPFGANTDGTHVLRVVMVPRS